MPKFKPYFKATTQRIKGSIKWSWDAGEEDKFKKYLSSLTFKETLTKIKITVERYRNDASTQQKRYLFGVVYPIIGEELGWDIWEYNEKIHKPFKAMFLGYQKVESTFDILRKEVAHPINIVELRSVAKIDSKDMTDFIENIRNFMLKEYNIHIPAPNEVDYEDLPEMMIED